MSHLTSPFVRAKIQTTRKIHNLACWTTKRQIVMSVCGALRSIYIQGMRDRSIQRNEIGLLQLTITWYKIRHAGGQAHYYSRTGTSKQRQVKLHWFRSLFFNLPAWRILYHVIASCKRPIGARNPAK